MLDQLWSQVTAFFGQQNVISFARAAAVLIVGLIVARLAARLLARLVAKRWSADHTEVFRRVTFYLAAVLVLAWAMRELGLRLGVLLGAAGVASVAIGFAAQTSLSNMISGFLLFGERPFRVGDFIIVEGETGQVLSVDLLSTKLRTYSNHYVRIPNETMMKSKVVNLTRFPIRRLDLEIPVAHAEDLGRVREVLMHAAQNNARALSEPPPLFFIVSYADSHVVAQFSVWAENENWLEFLETITLEIKQAFDQHEIRFPYPHRVVMSQPAG